LGVGRRIVHEFMAFEKSEASVEPVETVVDHLYGFI
jgi:hypothetical protein